MRGIWTHGRACVSQHGTTTWIGPRTAHLWVKNSHGNLGLLPENLRPSQTGFSQTFQKVEKNTVDRVPLCRTNRGLHARNGVLLTVHPLSVPRRITRLLIDSDKSGFSSRAFFTVGFQSTSIGTLQLRLFLNPVPPQRFALKPSSRPRDRLALHPRFCRLRNSRLPSLCHRRRRHSRGLCICLENRFGITSQTRTAPKLYW